MPYLVELPDGRAVEFPDDVSKDQAAQIIRQQLGGKFAPEPTIGGQVKEAFKGLVPGAVGLAESAATGISALLPEETEKAARVKIAEVAGAAKAPFAAAPGYEESVGRKLGEAVGSTIPFLGLGPLGLAGRTAAVGLGVGAGAGEARTRAEKAGATAEERATATALGMGPGALEAFAPFRILSRIPDAVTATGVNAIKRALVAGGEEAAQEAASNFAQNLIAKGVYKPEQELIEGLGESAAYGGATGAIVQGLLDLALGRRARGVGAPAAEPTTAPIDELKAKAAAEAQAKAEAKAQEAQAKAQAKAVKAAAKGEAVIPEPTVRKPGELPQVLDAATIKTIGFSRGNIKNLLMGKDLTDPAQLQEVKDILEAYKQEGAPAARTAEKIDAFLAKLPDAVQPVAEPSGVGVQVAGEPSAGAAPAGVGAPEPSGVVPAVEDVGQPPVGEAVAPSAVAEPAAPVAPEAQVETPPTPPAVQAPAAPAASEAPAVPVAPEAVAAPEVPKVPEAVAAPAPEPAPAPEAPTLESLKAEQEKLRTAAGRMPAVRSKARAQWDALQAQIDALTQQPAPTVPEAPAIPAVPEPAPVATLAPAERKNLIEQVEQVSGQIPVEEYDAFYEKHTTPDGNSVENTAASIKAAQDLIAKYSETPLVVRPTPGTQTPEMVAAAQAGDTRAALRAIETAADTTPLDKVVAKRLQQLGTLPKMQVVPADQVQGSAMYDTNTDTVLIAEGQADSHTIGHEVTHSALHKLIIANEQGKRNDAGYRDLKTLFDYLNKNYPNLKDEYGMKTVSEFSAEAMSNPQFQKQLAKIPYKAQTAWQWFGQAVRKLLALPQSQGSALLEALTAVDKTLYEGREYQVRGPKLEGAETKPSVLIGERREGGLAEETRKQIGERKVIGLRAKFADSLAGVEAKLNDLYANKIRDNSGDYNPVVLLSRALDAMRFSKAVQEYGTAVIEPGGLLTVQELDYNGEKISYKGVMQGIVDEAKRVGQKPKGFQRKIDELLYAHREYELMQTDPSLDFLLTPEQAAKLEAEYQSNEFVKDVSAKLDAIRYSMIDTLVASGRISEKVATEWKDATGYIPFKRIGEFDAQFQKAGRGGNRGLAAFKKMGSFKGSTEYASTSVTENFSELIDWMTKESMKNEAVRRALRELALINDAEKVPNPDALPEAKHGAVVSAYEDGKQVFYFVPDPANLMAFTVVPAEVPGFVKFAQKYFSQPLRAGVTSMPPFAIKQVVDDITRAYVYSGVKEPLALTARILTAFPKNWFNEVMGRKSPSVRELERHGIVATYDFHEQGNTKNILQEVGLEKKSLGTAIMRVLEAGAKASDVSVREAIYKQTLKETGDSALAEQRAREIINFSRRGAAKTMDFMIRTVPFFNAYARGMDKLLLAAAGNTPMQKITGTSTGSARALFHKRMMILTAMGLSYALLMSGDEGYEELPDQVRDKNWVLPVSKEYRKELGFTPVIPVPAELGFFFKAIPERIVQYYKLQGTPEEREALQIVSEMMKQGVDIFALPNMLPQAVKSLVENIANYSFFLDRPLESQAQIANYVPSERVGASTSPSVAAGTRKLAEKTGIQISPIKLENAIRGILGTSAGVLLNISDALVNPTRTERPLHQSLEAQVTGAGALMKDPVGTRYINDVYKLENETNQVFNTHNKLLNTDPEQAKKFLEQNYGLYSVRDEVTSIMQDIKDQADLAREIDANTSYTPAERRQAINELREKQNLTAKQVYALRRRAALLQKEADLYR